MALDEGLGGQKGHSVSAWIEGMGVCEGKRELKGC